MTTIKKGKVILPANQEYIQIDAGITFLSKPIVNISVKENVNVYLLDITTSSFKIYVSNTYEDDLEINYVAIGNT